MTIIHTHTYINIFIYIRVLQKKKRNKTHPVLKQCIKLFPLLSNHQNHGNDCMILTASHIRW